ncbi:MAG TPA: amidase [Stellaceae bacterium]|jgi:aspartyl-tRNA(Asn)/glutamyl-tRNA(Gln) amidotransferase subunit A|nr:amidase [Stellaceae bacterium]
MDMLTAVAASRALVAGRTSSAALVEDCLARIAAHDQHLNSFVLVLADEARRAARAADRARKAGRARGLLHGIPFGLKDIYDTAGIRTTAHSRLLLDRVPQRDSTVARKLGEAGAILIGKLATHEFATGGPAFDLPFPPARNPWNIAHFTGGSSSGSGAAVAAGLVPLAMGSDTSGSIRGPAGYCGIAGFKPTYGTVSRSGVIPLANSLDHCGPMAWTVADCALMLDAIAGHDPADPAAATRPYKSVRRGLTGGIAGMRIGVIRHFFERDIEADPQTLAAIEATLKVLRKLGAKLVPVTLPPHQDWDACCRVILYAEAYAIHERDLAERPEQYAAITRARLFSGQVVSAADYVQALRWRRALCRNYAETLDGLDAVVTGCTLNPAPLIDEMAKPPFFSPKGRLLMAPFSITGAPALSVCSGFSTDGLPLSLQIAGLPFADATVLRIGHAYEQATPWRERRPAL